MRPCGLHVTHLVDINVAEILEVDYRIAEFVHGDDHRYLRTNVRKLQEERVVAARFVLGETPLRLATTQLLRGAGGARCWRRLIDLHIGDAATNLVVGEAHFGQTHSQKHSFASADVPAHNRTTLKYNLIVSGRVLSVHVSLLENSQRKRTTREHQP